MRKTIILCILLITTVVITANAQFFVEGRANLSYGNSEASHVGKNASSSNSLFNVSPQVGYWLNDKIAVGTKASLYRRMFKGYLPDISGIQDLDNYYEERLLQWNFGLFCRNKIWGVKKISLLAESSVYIGGGNMVQKIELYTNKENAVAKKLESNTSFGFNVKPLFIYEVSDKWSIWAANLFILSLECKTVKNEETGIKNKPYLLLISHSKLHC